MREGRPGRPHSFESLTPTVCLKSFLFSRSSSTSSCLDAAWLDNATHDRSARRMTRTFLKASGYKGRSDAGPRKDRRHLIGLGFHRIAFDDLTTLAANEIDSRFQELHRQSPIPLVLANEETGDRPNRLIVDGLENSRSRQPRILHPWRDRTPRDRFSSDVPQQAWRFSRLNQAEHCLFVFGAFLAFKRRATQSPQHAPAAAAGTTLAEQCLEIHPTVRRQRMTLQPRRPRFSWSHTGSLQRFRERLGTSAQTTCVYEHRQTAVDTVPRRPEPTNGMPSHVRGIAGRDRRFRIQRLRSIGQQSSLAGEFDLGVRRECSCRLRRRLLDQLALQVRDLLSHHRILSRQGLDALRDALQLSRRLGHLSF